MTEGKEKLSPESNNQEAEEKLHPEEIERRKNILIEYIEMRVNEAKTRLAEHLNAYLNDAPPYSQQGSDCYHDVQYLGNVFNGVEVFIESIQNHIIFFGGDLLKEIKDLKAFSDSENKIWRLPYRQIDQLESVKKQGQMLVEILKGLEKYLLIVKKEAVVDGSKPLGKNIFLSSRQMMESMAIFFHGRKDNYSDELPVEHIKRYKGSTKKYKCGGSAIVGIRMKIDLLLSNNKIEDSKLVKECQDFDAHDFGSLDTTGRNFVVPQEIEMINHILDLLIKYFEARAKDEPAVSPWVNAPDKPLKFE